MSSQIKSFEGSFSTKGSKMDKKILIVEDDLSSQALAKEVLKNFGTITIADSVASAQLACQGQYYDIIILDLHLPDKSGIEFCSEIRSNENFRSSTIYIASADEDISKKVSAFSIGADDYIVKPYSPLELRARIERTLKKQNQGKTQFPFHQVIEYIIYPQNRLD